MKQYGISAFKKIDSDLDIHLENIKRKGFTILKGGLSSEKCSEYKSKIELVYAIQLKEFGEENLSKINELDVARMPFAYDDSFFRLIQNEKTLSIVRGILGQNIILHLQNAIINRNTKTHHQTSWHRDIPYQEYTTSKPISINVFYCLSPFNSKTGGTIFLPYSHLFSRAPSIHFFEENSVQPNLSPGDIVIFDSWVYHKAGVNTSDITRYGVNHVFTIPILKQQINIPDMLSNKVINDTELYNLLGYRFDIKDSVMGYRQKKIDKK